MRARRVGEMGKAMEGKEKERGVEGESEGRKGRQELPREGREEG